MWHRAFAALCLVASLMLAGCAVSIPLPSLLGEGDDTTASIPPPLDKQPDPQSGDASAAQPEVVAGKGSPSRR